MKVGSLVRVKSTRDGDSEWVVRVYKERAPVLLLKHDIPWGMILHEGRHKYIRLWQLEVVSG